MITEEQLKDIIEQATRNFVPTVVAAVQAGETNFYRGNLADAFDKFDREIKGGLHSLLHPIDPNWFKSNDWLNKKGA